LTLARYAIARVLVSSKLFLVRLFKVFYIEVLSAMIVVLVELILFTKSVRFDRKYDAKFVSQVEEALDIPFVSLIVLNVWPDRVTEVTVAVVLNPSFITVLVG